MKKLSQWSGLRTTAWSSNEFWVSRVSQTLLDFSTVPWSSSEILGNCEIPINNFITQWPAGGHFLQVILNWQFCLFAKFENWKCTFSSCTIPGKLFTESNRNIQTFVFDGGYDCFEHTVISQDVFSIAQYESLTGLTIKRTNLTYKDLNTALDFKQFKTLTHLDLSDNGFNSIDGNFGFSDDQLSKMTLDLSGNEIECSCAVSSGVRTLVSH